MATVGSKRNNCDDIIKQKVVLHPFVPSMVNNIEKWLENMALDGWELVRLSGWKFYFKQSKAKKRIYLMCTTFGKGLGLSNDYFQVKSKYKKSKNIINKSVNYIFEADELKIDRDFFFFRRVRNQYYKKHYFHFAIFSFVLLLLSLSFLQNMLQFFVFGFLSLCAFIYSIVSLFLISKADTTL